jgi:putative tricarboxylic transport membrane protein
MNNKSSDRFTGAFFAALGLFLFFYFIPSNVETINATWMKPESFPNVLALLLSFFGAVLIVLPSEQRMPDAIEVAKAGMYVATLIVGYYALTRFGFIIVAPFIALVIMLILGERRIFWLGIGTLLMPATIWFVIEFLLNRNLP